MKRIYSVIFLVSSSALIFEISLTRLFSIYLSYHFAFMVISIAMLGIGSAGTILAFYHKRLLILKDRGPKAENTVFAFYILLAGVSITFSYLVSNLIPFDPVKLSWDRLQIFHVLLYCLVLSIPFFFSGILISSAFLLFSQKSELIYSSDLLGAGTGSLAVIALLNIAGPEYAVFSSSTLCLIGGMIVGGKRIKIVSLVLILSNLLLFLLHPDSISVRISQYKSLSLSLKYPGAEHIKTYYNSLSRIDTLKSPAVRFAPGLSLRYLEPLPEQIGLSIDGGSINAITESKDKERLRFIEFLPSAVAYEIGRKGKVLVLEPKGGLHILIARYYGAKEIHKVESNPALVKVIKNDFREFSGGIFEDNTWTGFGRNWLQGLNESGLYDIIDFPMTGASVTGLFGISEDYRFTVEAFKEYLSALNLDGVLSISLYLIPPPRTEFRIVATIIKALEEEGARHIFRNIAAIRSWDNMVILVKNVPFTEQEIEGIKEFSRSRGFDTVYYPGIKQEETNLFIKLPSNEYYKGFKGLLSPETSSSFVSDYLFDIKPVYDENPFFHYYLRLKNLKAIYEVMGQKWLYFIEEGYLVPVILIIVLGLSLIMILMPAFFKTRLEQFKRFERLELFTLLYFAMLGIGFMFVEVTLIQKHILSLGNPAYAVAIVLTTMLISSGAGSMLSSRLTKLQTPYLTIVLGCLIFLYSLVHPLLMSFISPYSMVLKITIIFITLMPLGFFMGIPFPAGIKLIGQKKEGLIPWAWTINACLSVLAPVLTIMLAIVIGFKAVLWLGGLAYILAFISMRKLRG